MNTKTIDKALEFYNINLKYKKICYKCMEEINSNEMLKQKIYELYKVLFENEFNEIKKIWDFKNVEELLGISANSFLTNFIVLLGVDIHQQNMTKLNFNEEQICLHKKRVKECFESDLINRGYNGIRMSQMLWAVYFIRGRIIEIDNLQFEYENKFVVKIHIPKNTDLNNKKVRESIKKSEKELKRIYEINNFEYICNSWLLSNQIYEIIDRDTNISKFHDLFNVNDGEECISDILNFIYGIKACEDYSALIAVTTLQKKVKEQLLLGKTIYLGLGKLKKIYL